MNEIPTIKELAEENTLLNEYFARVCHILSRIPADVGYEQIRELTVNFRYPPRDCSSNAVQTTQKDSEIFPGTHEMLDRLTTKERDT